MSQDRTGGPPGVEDAPPNAVSLPLDSDPRAVTPLFAINTAVVLFLTGTALTASLTREWGQSSILIWSLAALVAMVLFALMLHPSIRLRGHVASLIAGVGAGVITILHLRRVTAMNLYPTVGSVDVVHHYALVQHLSLNGRLPGASTDASLSFLGEMVSYPFAAHVNAAVLADVIDVQPIVAMTLFAWLLMALSATLLVELTRRVVREIWPVSSDGFGAGSGVLVAFVFLWASRLTEGMVTTDYFYSQLAGIYLLIFLTLALMEAISRGSLVAIAASGFTCLLLALTYPLFSLLPIATVTLMLLIRHRSQWRRMATLLPIVAGTGLGLLLFLPGRVSTGLTIIENEGVTVTPSVSFFGGPVVIGLVVIGLFTTAAAFVSSRRRSTSVLPGMVLMVLLQMGSMYMLERTLGIGSYYMVEKLWFVLFWLSLPMLGVGVVAIARRILTETALTHLVTGVAITSSLLVVIAFWAALWVEEGDATPIISSDSFAVADWARATIDGQGRFAMAEGGTPGYMVYVGVLNQPRDAYSLAVLRPEEDLVQYWLARPEIAFLVTSNVDALLPVIEQHDLDIVHQLGTAAILTRQS